MCGGENDKEGKNEMVGSRGGGLRWGGQERLRVQRQTVREVVSD